MAEDVTANSRDAQESEAGSFAMICAAKMPAIVQACGEFEDADPVVFRRDRRLHE